MRITKFYVPLLVPVVFVVFLFAACRSNAVMEKNEIVKNESWEYADAKTFVAEIKDTTVNYNLSISLRHSFSFEWRNLWVKIETTFPDGKQFEKRVNLVLSTPDGQWNGDCLGDNCDIKIPIQENAFFPQKGKYTFKLTQDMRVNPLGFVKSVGMRVERYKAPE